MSTPNVDRWRAMVRRQQGSGLSVAAFCRQTGVPQASFYAWRRKVQEQASFAEVRVVREVRTRARVSATAGSTAAGLDNGSSAVVGRLESSQAPSQASSALGDSRREASGIELRLPGRRRVVVRRGFDRQTLMELLSVLESASPEAAARTDALPASAVRERGSDASHEAAQRESGTDASLREAKR